jgi:signal transduction histidine kinase
MDAIALSTLKEMFTISRKMAETRTLNPLLEYAIDAALRLFDAEYGYIVVTNADNTLDFRVKRNRNGEEINAPETQISRTILDKVISESRPVITASAIEDPIFGMADSVNTLALQSIMCAPLITRGRTIGGFYIENRSETDVFTDDDLDVLQHLAAQAAVAIDNAILNDELESRVNRRTQELQQINDQLQQEMHDRQLAEQRLVDLRVEQERVQILSNFVRDASHQFRTPLAVILTHLEVLQRKLGFDRTDAQFTIMREQVNAITQLIESLVLMVKLDTGVKVSFTSVDLNQVAREVTTSLQNYAEKKGNPINLAQDSTALMIVGDPDQLDIAVTHILRNALQHTPKGGVIALKTYAEDDNCVIEISDTGRGMSQEELDKVFSRFYRGDESGTTRGFGLGLSIAGKIIELHQGAIELTSEKGRGSTVRLIFPALPQ